MISVAQGGNHTVLRANSDDASRGTANHLFGSLPTASVAFVLVSIATTEVHEAQSCPLM